MPTVQRAPAWRRVRPWLSVVAAALLMLAALAGPALAHDGSSRLRDAVVTPRLARATTTIRMSVAYVDRSSTAPIEVDVEIDGRPRLMTAQASSRHDGKAVWFVASTRLSVGVHRIAFTATAADGSSLRLPAGLVRIVKTGSTGGGSGSASGGTAGGSGSGGTKPAGGAAGAGADSGSGTGSNGSAGPGAGGSHPSGSGTTDNGPAAQATSTGSGGAPGGSADAAPADAPATSQHHAPNEAAPADGAPVAPPGLRSEWADRWLPAAEKAGPQPAGSVDAAASSGPPNVPPDDSLGDLGFLAPDRGTTGTSGGSHPAAAPNANDVLGIGGGLPDELFRSTTILVTTGGSAMVWAAFVVFGRRRRDGEPPAPDPVLAAAAAAPFGAIETAELIPPSSGLPVPPGVDPTEAGLPRWRRPSLLQARKMDPLRNAVEAISLTFDDGAAASLAGIERRRIRYRLVTLMDVPDEVRANEIGILDRGDEVEIVDVRGTYRLVRCPDGQQGWLHQMVLGEVVGDDAEADDAPDGIDEDVLAAFIVTRQKTA